MKMSEILRRGRAELFTVFGTYHKTRADEAHRELEAMRLDLMASARSHGDTLDELRKKQEEIASLRRNVERLEHDASCDAELIRKLCLENEKRGGPMRRHISPRFVCGKRTVAPETGSGRIPVACNLDPGHEGPCGLRRPLKERLEEVRRPRPPLGESGPLCGRQVHANSDASCNQPTGHAGQCFYRNVHEAPKNDVNRCTRVTPHGGRGDSASRCRYYSGHSGHCSA